MTRPLRVLLSDGSGLTSRQVATNLDRAGHHVEALAPKGLGLARFTSHVAKVRTVPPYGIDPIAWFHVVEQLLRIEPFDVLFPTQEQVAVLALHHERVADLGVATAVPTFAALRAVQDKVSAATTLDEADIPQPPSRVLTGVAQLPEPGLDFPLYVKAPIGTASGGVRLVTDADHARALAAELAEDAGWQGPVLVQQPVPGPLMMVQSVFRAGRLVALHGNRRTGEGVNGGASHKTSEDTTAVRPHVEQLGETLAWHGALSCDVVMTPDGPSFIDINPRLVEPGNALRSGVDLVAALLDVALGGDRPPEPAGRTGVRTHQYGLAAMAAAQTGRRGAVVREVVDVALHRGGYRDSTEELTPLARDPKTIAALVGITAALVVRPALWSELSSGAVSGYALTPAAWATLCRLADA